MKTDCGFGELFNCRTISCGVNLSLRLYFVHYDRFGNSFAESQVQ